MRDETWCSYIIKSSISEAEHTQKKLKRASTASLAHRCTFIYTHTSPHNRIAFIDHPSVHNFLLHNNLLKTHLAYALSLPYLYVMDRDSVFTEFDCDRVFSSRLLIRKRDLAIGVHFKNTKNKPMYQVRLLDG